MGENLQSLSAAHIERIEDLTTPPPEFKAKGAAGVINIITPKRRAKGASGTVPGSIGNGGRYTINDARRFDLQDPDPTHLSGQQLYETIQLTETAIEKHMQVGYTIALINSMFPGPPATLSYDQIRTYLRSPYEQDPQGMSAAHQRTMDRLKAAGYVPQDDELAFPKSAFR